MIGGDFEGEGQKRGPDLYFFFFFNDRKEGERERNRHDVINIIPLTKV